MLNLKKDNNEKSKFQILFACINMARMYGLPIVQQKPRI